MSVMAKYVRIFWPDPKDDDVMRRNVAVESVQAQISDFDDPWIALRLASELGASVADGHARDEVATLVEKAIVDAGSAAFVRDNHDTEIIVMALVAALDLFRRESSDANRCPIDLLAAGLWSALSFQATVEQESLELLRQEVLVASMARTMAVAERSRTRAQVPEIGLLTLPEDQPTSGRANAAYRRATQPVVKALRDNAELDREELDFLWWVIEDWSETLGRRLSDVELLVRAVVAGIDGSLKLRRLPSSGHRNVVLRGIPSGTSADLGELLVALGDDRAVMAKSMVADRIGEFATIFPLLATIISGDSARAGSGIHRDAREWGGRALLEGGLLRLTASMDV